MNLKTFFTVLLSATVLGTTYAQSSHIESNEEVAKPKPKKYDKLLTVAPIQFTENGVGFAVAYEQAIDKEGIIAYNLPLVGTFNLTQQNYYGNRRQDPMFYFMPGLKFYPTGSHGKVKYALGPSIVAGYGKVSEDSWYPYIDQAYNQFLLGVMINNSMNVNVTKNIYMGLELGFGFTYVRQWDGNNKGIETLSQGSYKIGFRF